MRKQSGWMRGEGVQGDFRINDWLIQPQINTVERNGKTWHLEPKVMQVLVHLASHPDEVLSKERLIEAIWRDTFVGDDVLIRCISEIRYVFGDDARSSHVIQTIPKAGYRLIAAVTTEIGTATSLLASKDHAIKPLGNQNHEIDGGDHAVALRLQANELDKKITPSLSVNPEPPNSLLVEPKSDGLTEPETITMASTASPATADASSSIESGQSRRRPCLLAVGVVAGML